MEQDQRELFLREYWRPYPPRPKEGNWLPGTLLALTEKSLVVRSQRDQIIEAVVGKNFQISQLKSPFQFPLNSFLSVGDIVYMSGHLLDSGNLELNKLTLAAPNLEKSPVQLPDKKLWKEWIKFLAIVREFFRSNDFIEVQTPNLVASGAFESSLHSFSTNFVQEASTALVELSTSPEMHLKKLLSMGWDKIFEIAKVFRNQEFGDQHQPEFWMLEWYRAFQGLEEIAEDFEKLLLLLKEKGFIADNFCRLKRVSMADLFQQNFAFQLTPETSKEQLEKICLDLSLPTQGLETWNDYFHYIFVAKIEANLGLEGPILVADYPPSQAALARLNEAGWADRFEIYWRGFEIANAFNELTDPQELELRFQVENEERMAKGLKPHQKDEEFFRALRRGLPPSGGIALGLERLFLACNKKTSLKEIRLFPFNLC